MAKAGNKPNAESKGPKKSIVARIIPPLLVTIIAAGGGYVEGSLLRGSAASTEEHKTPATVEHGAAAVETEIATAEPHKGEVEKTVVRSLAPIVSNLGSPSETWMRLEISILMHEMEQAEQDELAVKAADSVVGFLRTVNLKSIEGPSGFTHFREDLSDILKSTFNGKITGVLIGSMVVE